MMIDLSRRATGLVAVLLPTLGAFTPASSGAQERGPRFTSLTKEQGLADNTVEAIAEDSRGFLWFGTPDGLARYDAHSVTVYRHDSEDPTSLSSSYAQALVEDSKGVLWIGTHEGLNAYDRETDSFVRYLSDPQDPKTLGHGHVNTVVEDRQGQLWVGTGEGLSRFDRASGSFVRYPPERYSPERPRCAANVREVVEDRAGELWLGLEQCGVVRFDPRTGASVHYLHAQDRPDSLSNNDVWDLIEDRNGDVWVATMGGLNRFDRATGSFSRWLHDGNHPGSIPSNHVDALLEDSEGRLWVATDGGGLAVLDRATGTFAGYRHDPSDDTSLGSDVIRTIYEDRRGDLWIGTYIGGVAFFSRSTAQFSYYRHLAERPNSLSHSAVLSFFEDGDGILWIGTEGGLNRFDPRTGLFSAYRHDESDPGSLSADAVLSVLRDSRGNLWAGTYYGGLNRFDPRTGTFIRYQHDPDDPTALSSPHVWALFEDSRGRLWAGTFNGVNRFDYESETFVRYLHDPGDDTSVGHDIVWGFHEDDDGFLWLATLWGLSRYDPAEDNFRTYRNVEGDDTSLGHDELLSIHQGGDGRLWLGTEGGGLNVFDRETETFRSFRRRDGLPSDKVYGILEDSRNKLWLSTNEGLSRFDPRTGTFTNYTRSDGLLAYPFFRNACLKTRSGEMLFGGVHGFSGLFPDDIRDNPHVPPVVLTGFTVFNQPMRASADGGPLRRHITEAEEIRLRHDQSVISFSFAALNYRAPEKNQYAYKLESFDEDWNHVGTQRSATYTNLDPGRYTFRVKASNNSGLWNERGRAIAVVVLPPYWATWWFRGLSVLAGSGLLLGAYQVRVSSIRKRNRMLRAEIDERKRVEADRKRLLQEMEAKNAELAESNLAFEAKNAELERFTYTVSHDLTSPLVTIKGFLGMLRRDADAGDAARMAEDIEHIESAADSMNRLLSDLLELSRVGRVVNPSERIDLTDLAREAAGLVAGTATERGVAIDVQPGMPTVVADRTRMLEVFQNLIENAVKFMGEQGRPRVSVSAAVETGEVLCHVVDNGRGIDPKYHQKVFGLFERLGAEAEGTGVGLALVQRIVELHGGRVWVESAGRGRGSRFSFTIPVDDGSASTGSTGAAAPVG